MASHTIYLDYNATTAATPEVIEAMLPWLRQPTNPSSPHAHGRVAAHALQQARETLASSVGATASKIVLTSGATESNNMVFRGLGRPVGRRNKILVLATEHKAVLEPAAALAEEGYSVVTLPVQRNGLVDLVALQEVLDDSVALCSIHMVNNETGVVQPIASAAEMVHAVGARFHTDATQALGKMEVDVRRIDVDFASFSSHKLHGPQGVGALYIGTNVLTPKVRGGGQERGLRPGTENVAGAVGFATAAELAVATLHAFQTQASRQVALLMSGISNATSDVEAVVTGETPRVANTLSLRIHRVDAEALVAHTPGVAFTTGSACTSMVPEPSHVLTAMLRDSVAASECVRLSTGRPTTDDEVCEAARQLATSINRVRALS